TPPAGCARQPVGGLQTHYGPWNQEMGGFWANAAGALAKRSACAGRGICGPNTGSATCKSAGMAVAAHIWHRAQFSQPSCDAMVADGLAWCVEAASAVAAMSSQWWPPACAAAGAPWCAVVATLAVSAAAMRVAISSLAMPRRGARAINRTRRTTRMVWMIRRRLTKFRMRCTCRLAPIGSRHDALHELVEHRHCEGGVPMVGAPHHTFCDERAACRSQ
ncbi:MAG: hypothetical protein RJB68_2211, partial [Pseudomonadota bacterium]